MPAKFNSGGISATEVDANLPRTFFVMRGHVQRAFGLTKQEMRVLIEQKTFRAEYPFPKRTGARGEPKARFVRSQVLAVARRWEATA